MNISVLCYLCLSLSALAASEDLPFTHMDPPPVKSWKTMRDEGIVKQDLDYSCGAASIATLLNQYYGQELTEEDVLRLLQKEAAKEGMASFADMQRILPQLGFRAEGYALSFEQLMQLGVRDKFQAVFEFSLPKGQNSG